MRFSIKEWRKGYDMVHEMGQMLHDSRPYDDTEGNACMPKIELSKGARDALEHRINTVLQKTSKYLDQCSMRMPKALWYYDRNDSETCMSSPKFKYHHLIQE